MVTNVHEATSNYETIIRSAIGRFIELCLYSGSANEKNTARGNQALFAVDENGGRPRGKAGRREGGGSVARYGDR